MKKLIPILIAVLMPLSAFANDSKQRIRSAEQQGEENTQSLVFKEYQLEQPLLRSQSGNRQPQAPTTALKAYTEFEIFDAWVDLSGDLDGDGYYHHIGISFDADVNAELFEAVFAKIYLSRDGGPWFLLSSTDLFEIYSDDSDDVYHFYSDLVEGFPPGYYSVLIELHSLYHSGFVSAYEIDHDNLGDVIALEDSSYDAHYVEETDVVVTYTHSSQTNGYVDAGYYHSGSFNLTGLGIMLVLVILKTRRKSIRTGAESPAQQV